MRHAITFVAVAALLLPAAAEAQSARVAMPPSSAGAPQRDARPHRRPYTRRDGHVVLHSRGAEHPIRSCSAYFGPNGTAGPAPQGGAGSRPPGANGLSPAPGMQPAPGALQPAPGLSPAPGATSGSSGRATAGSTSSLEPLHSGWRTVGTVYLDGVCYLRDRQGNLQLFQF